MGMNIFRGQKTFYRLLMPLLVAACSSGGDVTGSLNDTLSPVFVQAPTVAVPNTTTYYSNQSTLEVSGLCNTGYTVRLSEDIIHEQSCVNSQYSFTINKVLDGFYPLALTQFHPEFGVSRQNTVIWIRKSSVTVPTVTSPATNPFSSGLSTITLSGGCETGATVTVSGEITGSTTCMNSTYMVSATKYDEGVLNIQVTQTDLALNQASMNFVWNRQHLTVSPGAPQLVAGETTVFTPQGGSLSYTSLLVENNSGATYDPNTREYTAGALSGVTDTLRFQDSLGSIVDVAVDVISGVPDHFELPADSGDLQLTQIGHLTALPVKVKVVDQFGNRVPNISILFSVLGGDAHLVGSPQVLTDSDGVAQIPVRMGYTSQRSIIGVKPAAGVFPDLAGSNNNTLTLNLFSTTSGTGSSALEMATANNPTIIEMGDFDNDGSKDIAVLNAGDPSIGLFYGRGFGLVSAMIKITPICTGPSHMTSGDFNEDTYTDFIVTCSGSGRISTILSDGSGGFLPVQHIDVDPTETIPVAIVAADFNGDGHLDIVTLSAASYVASLRHGVGNGTFGVHTEYAVGSGPSQLAVGDFDHDGRKDVAVVNSGENTVGVLMNNSLGGFFNYSFSLVGAAPSSIVVKDFNNDSYDDIAVVNNIDNSLMVLVNDQFGSFLPPTPINTGMGPISMVSADIDGDNILDILVANLDSHTLSPFYGNGDGSFITGSEVDTLTNPIFVAAGDLDGNGHTDVVISSSGAQQIQIFIGQGNGVLGLEGATESNPAATVLVDVDNDGLQDLVVVQTGSNKTSIFKGNGSGLWTPLSTISSGVGPSGVVAGDFNRDGFVDLAIIYQNIASLRIFEGDGTGQFASPYIYSTGVQPSSIVAHDLNNDGHLDIAVSHSGANTIGVFANNGNGTFQNRVDFATGSQPTSLVAADFNNDFEIDLAVTNQIPGSISVLLSNGDLTYQPHIESTTGNGSTSLVAGYMNGDGFIDVAVLNETDGMISILLGLGNGGFQAPVNFSVSTTSRSLVSGDFNGDSRLDLMVVNGGLETATMLFGGGNGTFNTSKTISVFHGANLLTTGDFNNDNIVDFVTIDSNLTSLKSWPGF